LACRPFYVVRGLLDSAGLVEALAGRVGRQESENQNCKSANERNEAEQGEPAAEVAIVQTTDQQRNGRNEYGQVERKDQNKPDNCARAGDCRSVCRDRRTCSTEDASKELQYKADDTQREGHPPVLAAARTAGEGGVLLEETLYGGADWCAIVRGPQRRFAGLCAIRLGVLWLLLVTQGVPPGLGVNNAMRPKLCEESLLIVVVSAVFMQVDGQN